MPSRSYWSRRRGEDTYVYEQLHLVLLQVSSYLSCQEDAGTGTQLAVLLVEFALEHQLLKVDKGHGHGGLLVATLLLGQLLDLPFQTVRGGGTRLERGQTLIKRGLL